MFSPLSKVRLLWQLLVTSASLATLAIMPIAWAFPSVPESVALAVRDRVGRFERAPPNILRGHATDTLSLSLRHSRAMLLLLPLLLG